MKFDHVSKITTRPHPYLDTIVWEAECNAAGYLFRSSIKLEDAHATEAEAVAALRAKVTEWALKTIEQVRAVGIKETP